MARYLAGNLQKIDLIAIHLLPKHQLTSYPIVQLQDCQAPGFGCKRGPRRAAQVDENSGMAIRD
jgi:hypothetical protein